MRIVVYKQWRVYLDFGRACSLRFTVILNLPQITAYQVAVNSHALPIYKKNRIASLLCIFETTIQNFIAYVISLSDKITHITVKIAVTREYEDE